MTSLIAGSSSTTSTVPAAVSRPGPMVSARAARAAAGSSIVTVVPQPGSERSHALPPACAVNLRTALRPSPAAWSPVFVVKKGSKARSAITGSMPGPVSVMHSAT